MRQPGMNDDSVADQGVADRNPGADRTVAPDTHFGLDDGVGADHAAGADFGSCADDCPRLDGNAVFQPGGRMHMGAGKLVGRIK